jgi:hypothetical protein
MFAKSDSVNGALLNARRAGPACGEKLDPYWYAFILHETTMDDNNIVKPDTAEWTEEVIAEGKQIRPPMLAIPFKTIVEHFQNIIGPLIHEKITRHPGANTQETVSAILPPGFHQYLFFNFAGETNDRKTIIEYLGDYSTKLFAAGSFAIIWKLTTKQSDQKTKIGFEYGVFNSKFVLQAPRGL